MLGLGASLSKGGLVTPGIVTDSLVLKHNYAAGGVVPVSDGAAYFVASATDYITMGDACDLGTGDFSITLWAYLPEGSSQNFISKFTTADNRWFLQTSGSDKIQFQSRVASSTIMTQAYDGDDVPQNEWFYVAVTCDRSDGSSGLKLYLNGIVGTASAASATDMDNDADLYFGRQDTTYMGGYICNVGIWSAALTQAQIKSIMWKNYAGLTSSETDNLVSWWILDAGYDENYHNGTLYGTVLDNHHGGNTSSFGSEMVSNGDFSNGTTGWFKQDDASVSYSVVNTGLELRISSTSDGGEYGHVTTEVNLVVGTTYKVELNIVQAVNVTGDGIRYIRLGASNAQYDNGSGQTDIYNGDGADSGDSQYYYLEIGTNVFYYKHSGPGTYLVIGARNDVTSLIIDNVSVKEVLGNTGQTL